MYCFMYPEEYGMDEKKKSDSYRCTRLRESLTMLKTRKISEEILYVTNLIKCLLTRVPSL